MARLIEIPDVTEELVEQWVEEITNRLGFHRATLAVHWDAWTCYDGSDHREGCMLTDPARDDEYRALMREVPGRPERV